MTEQCPCPEHYPDWDGKSINLGGWCVHEMGIASFFHMPMAYDMYVSKQAENISQLELTEKWPGFMLTRTGMWGGKIVRLLADCQSPSRMVKYLPGDFMLMVKLHHGTVDSVAKVVHQMQIDMVEKGCIPKELYLAHLTCPICRDRKGGDKIMILRKFKANERIRERIEKENQKIAAKAKAEAVET